MQVCSQARLLPSIQLRLLSGNVSAMEPPVPPSCKLSGADSDSGLHFHRSQSVHPQVNHEDNLHPPHDEHWNLRPFSASEAGTRCSVNAAFASRLDSEIMRRFSLGYVDSVLIQSVKETCLFAQLEAFCSNLDSRLPGAVL